MILLIACALIFLWRAWRAGDKTERIITAVGVILWVLWLLYALGFYEIPARLSGMQR